MDQNLCNALQFDSDVNTTGATEESALRGLPKIFQEFRMPLYLIRVFSPCHFFNELLAKGKGNEGF